MERYVFANRRNFSVHWLPVSMEQLSIFGQASGVFNEFTIENYSIAMHDVEDIFPHISNQTK
jgi:hypothetical protein